MEAIKFLVFIFLAPSFSHCLFGGFGCVFPRRVLAVLLVGINLFRKDFYHGWHGWHGWEIRLFLSVPSVKSVVQFLWLRLAGLREQKACKSHALAQSHIMPQTFLERAQFGG
jgi:hypothetical protein